MEYITLITTEKVKSAVIAKYGKIVDKKSLSYTIEIAAENQASKISKIMEELPIEDIDIAHVPLEEIVADMFTK